jgi:hypothetical protein
LQVLPAIAFLAQVVTAPASFFGFAPLGALALSMHPAPPDVQLWIESSIVWQSLFLPQAASGFAQALSTQEPQSVLPKVAGGGAAGAGASVLDAAGGGVSSAADDEASGAAALSFVAGVDEPPSELSSDAAVSGGLASPPPQASQANGSEAARNNAVTGKRWARLMGPFS